MILTKRTLGPAVLAALLSVSTVSSQTVHAAVKREGLPAPMPLLRSVIQAHKKLGPATITLSFVGGSSPAKARGTSVVQRNDPSHFKVSSTLHGLKESLGSPVDTTGFEIYSNAGEPVVFYPQRNAYRRNPPLTNAKGFSAEIYGGSMQVLQDLIARFEGDEADGYPIAQDYYVTSGVLNGEPVYVFQMRPDAMEDTGLRRFSVVVARRDRLVRKMVMGYKGDTPAVVTFRYQRRKEPFPVASFQFTPPKGAVEMEP